MTWNRPAQPTDQTHPIRFYYPPPIFEPLDRPPDREDREFFREELKRKGINCGFSWLLAPEPPQMDLPSVVVDDILADAGFVGSSNQVGYFLQKMSLTTTQIWDIERSTRGQRDNVLWGMLRKGRLTASNFGKVLKASSSNRQLPKSLFKSLLGEYNLSGLKAIQYGIHHEAEAIRAYEKIMNNKVEDAGLVLHPSGLIGASPDGFVGDEIVLEVKCPWSARDCTSVEDLMNIKGFFLVKDDSGNISFAKTDQGQAYFHQIQGQLALTGRNLCHFVIWTPQVQLITVIPSDPAWTQNLQTLIDFYVNHFFKVLTNGIE